MKKIEQMTTRRCHATCCIGDGYIIVRLSYPPLLADRDRRYSISKDPALFFCAVQERACKVGSVSQGSASRNEGLDCGSDNKNITRIAAHDFFQPSAQKNGGAWAQTPVLPSLRACSYQHCHVVSLENGGCGGLVPTMQCLVTSMAVPSIWCQVAQ
jgi:hypothetical protein